MPQSKPAAAFSFALLAVLVGCSASTDDVESIGITGGALTGGATAVGPLASTTVDAPFVVTGLARKCIDFGGAAYQAVGSPVMLYACNGSIAQQVRVVEIADGTHDVWLAAGTRFCFGVRGGVVAAGKPLELQTCNGASPAQRFALDGDAIYLGTQTNGAVKRDLVVEVDHGRGANRTALIVGTREIDDAEDFRFTAAGGAFFPHSGFTRVSTVPELDFALTAATWGSVVEVAPGANLVVNDTNERPLHAGVTLRGNRKGTEIGPQINRNDRDAGVFLRVNGNDARVTGLRLRGPNTAKDDDLPLVTGVQADESFRVTVDHNEMSAWTGAAVTAQGAFDDSPECRDFRTPNGDPASDGPHAIKVIKNYIHDNSRRNSGYGVVSGDGSNPYVDGNTFGRNRHAIASDNNAHSHYTAVYNLVTEGNGYCDAWVVCWKEQDFDVHGTGEGGHYQGGNAGGLYYMKNNTFLDSGKNVDIRGTPCRAVFLWDNVFASDDGTAIKNATEIVNHVVIWDNTYSASQSTTLTADFDGDGAPDDFLATGAAWYYRHGSSREWLFLNRLTERMDRLTFGDFDGDGRTDVRALNTANGRTETSWGGSSPWDQPAGVTVPIGVVPPIGGTTSKE